MKKRDDLKDVIREEASRGKKRPVSDAFSDLWQRVDSSISKVLDHTSFAELARTWRESQTRYVPNWEI